mgnify:FL=1
MKRILNIIIPFILLTATTSAQKPQLRFHDGDFKIMQLTDLHLINRGDYKALRDSTYNLIRVLIDTEKPDMVVLTGDCVIWCDAEGSWKELSDVFVEKETPFSVTFGNHDEETDWDNARILDYLKNVPYFLTYDEAPVSGSGNCSIPILSSEGDQVKWVLYMLDSHNNLKDRTMGYYDWIHYDQIEWYRERSDHYTAANEGTPLPSLAFFHIPFQEFDSMKWGFGKYGYDKEGVCAPRVNSGLFSSFLDKKDVVGVFVGHDHNDDYLIDVGGKICLAYGRKTGYTPAYTEVLDRGCRIINLYENEHRFDTYIEDLNGKHFNYTFEQKNDGKPIARIDGTFFQPYEAYSWDDARWDSEMQVFKNAGMHYLIFAPTMETDQKGKTYCHYDVLEKCLRSAQKFGMRVFVGLNSNERWWKNDFSEEWLYSQMETGNKLADELVARYKEKYQKAMHGWYWVWEVDNLNTDTPQKEQILANAMNINLDHLDRITPSMPFLFSPFVNYRVGKDKDETASMWKRILPKVHFRGGDIFCPQDCVGAGGLELNMQEEWMRALSEAARTVEGLKFWVNVETFDQKHWSSAPLTRVVEQLRTANWVSSNIICFSYSAYNSPNAVNDNYDKVYREYLKTGALPDATVPAAPSGLKIKKVKDGIRLTWKCSGEENTAGYNVYRDGGLVKKILKRKGKDCETLLVKDAGINSEFKVSAYNVLDKESSQTSLQ